MKKFISMILLLSFLLINSFALAEDNSICGIGINLQKKKDVFNNPYLVIIEVFNNSPAQAVGLKGGDKILEINNKNTNDMSLQDAAYSIKGEKGSNVRLLVKRDSGEFTYNVRFYWKVCEKSYKIA